MHALRLLLGISLVGYCLAIDSKEELYKRGLKVLINVTSGYNGSLPLADHATVHDDQSVFLSFWNGLLELFSLSPDDIDGSLLDDESGHRVLEQLGADIEDSDETESDSLLYNAVSNLSPSFASRVARLFASEDSSRRSIRQQPNFLLPTPKEWSVHLPQLLLERPPLTSQELAQVLPRIDDNLIPVEKRRQQLVRYFAILGLDGHHRDSVILLADMQLMGFYDMQINATIARHFYSIATEHFGTAGHAQFVLGLLYSTGIGGARDQAKANLYYTQSALAGDPRAQQAMGYRYSAGIGTPPSCEVALSYYKSVAKHCIMDYLEGPPLGRRLKLRKISLPELVDGGVYGSMVSPNEALNQDSAELGAGGGRQRTYRRSISRQYAHSEKDLLLYYEAAAEKDPLARFALGYSYYRDAEGFPEYYKIAQIHFYLAATHVTGKAPGSTLLPGSQTPSVFDPPLAPNAAAAGGLNFAPVTSSRMQACVQAMGYLGLMAWRGEGQKADPAVARMWFEKAAHFSDGLSLNALGVMLKPVDFAKATQLFARASEMDNGDGHVNLGIIHLEDGDYASAAKLFSLGVRQGHPLAYFYHAYMLERGMGMQRHCHLALHYYKVLSERNDWFDDSHNDAFDSLVDGYVDHAFLKFLIAAERGYEVAQTSVAWLLDQQLYRTLESPLTSEDAYSFALVYWNRAALQGKADAKNKVGDYWFYGIGTSLFSKVIKAEKSDAKDESALLYQQISADQRAGDDSGTNDTSSTLTDTDTCTLLHPRCWLEILQLFCGILPKPSGPRSATRAAQYYLMAAEQRHSSMAQWNLGYMHEYGIGVECDYHLAKRYYDLAVESNPAAYLASYTALLRLSLKRAWSVITQRETRSNPQPKKAAAQPLAPELKEKKSSVEADSRVVNDELFESVLAIVFCVLAVLLLWYRNRLRRVANVDADANRTARNVQQPNDFGLPQGFSSTLNPRFQGSQSSSATNTELNSSFRSRAAYSSDNISVASTTSESASTGTPVRIPRRKSSITMTASQSKELRESLQKLASSASKNSIADDSHRDEKN